MKWAFAAVIYLISTNSIAFNDFDSESKKVTKNIGCIKPKIMAGSSNWGKLYTCITGSAETVKFFINETPGTNKVKNVKFMWNDWSKDTGYGIHADSKMAKAWAATLATMYAPLQVEAVINAFKSNKSRVIKSDDYILEYTFTRGPAIDERLIVVTKK